MDERDAARQKAKATNLDSNTENLETRQLMKSERTDLNILTISAVSVKKIRTPQNFIKLQKGKQDLRTLGPQQP